MLIIIGFFAIKESVYCSHFLGFVGLLVLMGKVLFF